MDKLNEDYTERISELKVFHQELFRIEKKMRIEKGVDLNSPSEVSLKCAICII